MLTKPLFLQPSGAGIHRQYHSPEIPQKNPLVSKEAFPQEEFQEIPYEDGAYYGDNYSPDNWDYASSGDDDYADQVKPLIHYEIVIMVIYLHSHRWEK